MAMQYDRINWSKEEGAASEMSLARLWSEIAMIQTTLESADDLDRSDDGNRGGFYRDLISVYRKELKIRGF